MFAFLAAAWGVIYGMTVLADVVAVRNGDDAYAHVAAQSDNARICWSGRVQVCPEGAEYDCVEVKGRTATSFGGGCAKHAYNFATCSNPVFYELDELLCSDIADAVRAAIAAHTSLMVQLSCLAGTWGLCCIGCAYHCAAHGTAVKCWGPYAVDTVFILMQLIQQIAVVMSLDTLDPRVQDAVRTQCGASPWPSDDVLGTSSNATLEEAGFYAGSPDIGKELFFVGIVILSFAFVLVVFPSVVKDKEKPPQLEHGYNWCWWRKQRKPDGVSPASAEVGNAVELAPAAGYLPVASVADTKTFRTSPHDISSPGAPTAGVGATV